MPDIVYYYPEGGEWEDDSDDDEDEDEVNKNDHTVKHVPTVSIKERTEKDLNRMLAGLGDSLTGDK